jgi:hypothetical protein
MAQNLQLDPNGALGLAKDYVVVNGSPVPSDRVLEATYYALEIPQGQWIYGIVSQGSLLYTLQNVKRTASIEQQFAGFSQAAILANVITPGKATASQVTNQQATPTGTENLIAVQPANTQLSSQLNFVPV